MNADARALLDQMLGLWQQVLSVVSEPVVVLQAGVVVLLLIASRIIAARVEPALEAQARTIKGKPRQLRFIINILRRSRWLMFVVLLLFALVLMRSVNWPASTRLVYIVFLLALAWFVIAVASHTMRSKFMARLIAIAGWIYVALAILGITDEVGSLLDSTAFAVGNVRISLLLVMKTVFFLGFTLWLAVSVGNLLETRIQRTEELTPSLRVLLGKVLKITLIIIATLVAIAGIGIDLTVFTVFSGAIGVGIGFGLQKVVSNFISGIIILMDESIKPGDTISLGETFGWIRELRARFVSVVTQDGKEYLIPNEDFITQRVINWSFSDDLVRLDVPFGVAYDADPHQVTRLAIEAAAGVDRVVATQQPVCWLTEFGDSSLNFLLRFWIRDPQNGLTNVRGKVLLALWDTFKANGVKIPYPHREVILHSDPHPGA
ncbi:MAG: hypothetical protein RLZZ385_2136 [Pseudomonadota bacterium]|jgi:small-conductance mechanosensitive channel